MRSSEPAMPPDQNGPEDDKDRGVRADRARQGRIDDRRRAESGHEQDDQAQPVGDRRTGALWQPVAEQHPDARSGQHGCHIQRSSGTSQHRISFRHESATNPVGIISRGRGKTS